MTDEYIRKQEAIDIVVFECGKWTGLAKEISKQLKQLSAANIVSVVRCRDCKHWKSYYGRCCKHDEYGMASDDFCSYGERRDG